MDSVTAPPALILASASPRRSALLREAGYTFAVVVPNAVELEPGARPPEALCLANARRKARCVAARHPEALVLGCDTIVCLGDLVLGKPDNLDEARRYLRLLQGRTHRVLTGLALCRVCDGLERAVVETTAVTFHPLDEAAFDSFEGAG